MWSRKCCAADCLSFCLFSFLLDIVLSVFRIMASDHPFGIFKLFCTKVTFCWNSRHFGTCVRHFGTMTNRHPDNSAPQLDKSVLVFFFFDFTYKTSNSLEPIPNFNYVCSGKDPDHADSNPDPRSVIDEKKRLILFFFLVMLMFALYNIMVRIVILMFCNPFFCILSFNNCV